MRTASLLAPKFAWPSAATVVTSHGSVSALDILGHSLRIRPGTRLVQLFQQWKLAKLCVPRYSSPRAWAVLLFAYGVLRRSRGTAKIIHGCSRPPVQPMNFCVPRCAEVE